MPRYTRLRGSDFEESDFLFVKAPEGMGTLYLGGREDGAHSDGGTGGEEGSGSAWSSRERILLREILSSSKSQYMKGYSHSNRSLSAAPLQNVENGNPNVTADPAPIQAIAAACAQSANGVYVEERSLGGGAKTGGSSSARWAGGSVEEMRFCMGGGGQSFKREEATVPQPAEDLKSLSCREWAAASVHRVASCREVTQRQTQQTGVVGVSPSLRSDDRLPGQARDPDEPPCALHSSCNDVRHSRSFARNPSVKEGSSAPVSIVGNVEIDRPFGTLMAVRRPSRRSISDSDGGMGLHERISSSFQRSLSMKDIVGSRTGMPLENWTRQSSATARRAHSGAGSRHRVSFSVIENQENLDGGTEQQQHEKWREPPISHRILGGGGHPEPMRYNYEQPGFVERGKDAAGSAYTVYSVHGRKDCPKGSGRQPPLSRAFSLREKGSSYTRIARTFAVNNGKRDVPVVCVTCGGGLAVVVCGFPGNESSLCPTCNPPAMAAGGGLGLGTWSFPDKSLKKKKSMLDYCRKFLGLSKKGR